MYRRLLRGVFIVILFILWRSLMVFESSLLELEVISRFRGAFDFVFFQVLSDMLFV
jgi:hypothetical protein